MLEELTLYWFIALLVVLSIAFAIGRYLLGVDRLIRYNRVQIRLLAVMAEKLGCDVDELRRIITSED